MEQGNNMLKHYYPSGDLLIIHPCMTPAGRSPIRNIFFFFILFISLFQLSACTYNSRTDSAESTFVISVDRRIEPVGNFTNLLGDMVQTIQSSDTFNNFILFVHGRGKHPEKAFEKAILSNLESNYSAKVIMFNWPSWNGALSFPEDQARSSADDFINVLRQLKSFKNNNPQLTNNIRFTLLTHSMGSLVLEQASKQGDLATDLFDTLIINSSASAGKGHADWLNRIALSENIYVTVNRDDSILGPAGARLAGRRLGKGLTSRSGEEFKLADNTNYIDVTRTGVNHRYYIYPGMNNSTTLKVFYNRVLNGLPASLDRDNGIIKIERDRVYILR